MNRHNLPEKTLGLLCGILSAVFVAGYVTTNKYIYTHYDISALEYSLIFAIFGAFFALISLQFQRNAENTTLIKQNFKPLLAVGVAGTMAVAIFVVGQRYTSAVNASLLMTATIVATGFFSHLLLKERHHKTQYVWIVALFVGLYIGVVGFRSLALHKGDAIILGSALFFGFGNAYSRVVMKQMGGARLVPDVRLAIGGVIALAASPFIINDLALVRSLLPFAVLAGLFYWLCMKTFARAVYLINANNTIVLNNMQIFFSALAGVLILSEPYSFEKLIGSVIALTSIYFIAYKEHQNN